MAAKSDKMCCCAKPQTAAIADEAERESFPVNDPPSSTFGEQKKGCCSPSANRSSREPAASRRPADQGKAG